MRRLALIRHATTDAVRRAAFPIDEPLDEGGLAAAAQLAGRLPRGDAVCSPSVRARATAQAAGLEPEVEPLICECDFGMWAGRALEEVHAEQPEAVAAWMTDPDACPHGGESLSALLARVGGWMDAQAQLDGRAIAVTHGGVVRAAVVYALGAPAPAAWRIDVAPLTLTELHARDGRWTVTCVNAPVTGGGAR